MTPQIETLPLQKKQPRSYRAIRRILVCVIILLALVAVGAFPRFARQREALAAAREAPATHPVVAVIHARQGEPTSILVLPGNIEPLYTSNLYARIDGYLESRAVDIGSRVSSGQLLAVVSSPEVDQQLLGAKATLAQSQASLQQAKAALEQAKANAELTRLTKERYVPLGQQQAISQQEVDGAVQSHNARIADTSAAMANIAAAEANVTANRANVSRLEQMQSFERIVAPFDGVITARNVERGDLISIGNANAGKPLFTVAQSGALRIQIDVPQSEAVNIADGQKATVSVKERPGRTYTGTVVRNAAALNNAARTMLTEVQIDNRDGSLLPGMYAEIKFTLRQQRASFIIPASSLVVDRTGMHVVAVDSNGVLHFLPVTIAKDMGIDVEIATGLHGAEALVASPSDLLNDGQHVEIR